MPAPPEPLRRRPSAAGRLGLIAACVIWGATLSLLALIAFGDRAALGDRGQGAMVALALFLQFLMLFCVVVSGIACLRSLRRPNHSHTAAIVGLALTGSWLLLVALAVLISAMR